MEGKVKILKAIWFVFESICFALGLFILISVLTTLLNGGSINVKKNGEQVYCYSTDKQMCINSSEDNK